MSTLIPSDDELFGSKPAIQSTKRKSLIPDDAELFAAMPEEAPKRNVFARVNDLAIDTANSAVGMVKSGVDLFAPGSDTSGALGGFIKSGEESQSDFKKWTRKKLASDLASADGEVDKVKVYAGHVANDPMEVVGQAAGNIGPLQALGLAFRAAGWGTKAMMMAAGGLSAGEVRGNILEKVLGKSDADLAKENSTYAEMRASGVSEAEAKKQVGTKFVQHLPELIATALVGSLGGKYGLEGIASGLGRQAKSRVGAAAVSALDEGVQGAVEQLATNVGARRIDPTQKLGDDVLLNAVQEGLPGGVAGGVAGGRAKTPAAVGAPLTQPPTQEQPGAQPAAQPTAAQQAAQSAFVDVMGDEGVIAAKRAEQGLIALSLSQISSNDGEQGLVSAIEHVAAGDQAMAERLYAASQDPELVQVGKAAMGENTMGFIEINDAIRTESGLVDAPAQTDVPATPAADPAPAIDLVKQGLVTGGAIPLEAADSVDLTGLQQAVVTAQDGSQVLLFSKDAETVQAAVARSAEVGVEAAVSEMFGPAAGKAVVQKYDPVTGEIQAEGVVDPGAVDSIQADPTSSTLIRPVAEVLAERAQEVNTSQAPVQNQPETVQVGPTFMRSATKVKNAFTAAEQTGAAVSLVERMNQELGLQGELAINPQSLTEVTPEKNLRRMRDAIGTAFGTKLVFVHAPDGLVRNNGTAFNRFGGVAVPDSNTIFLNVESNAPLNVLGHELAHVLEGQHPEIYEKLEMVVLSRMRAEAARRLRDSLQAASSSEGTVNSLRREVVAEGIGEMAEDASLWRDVFGEIGEEQTLAKTFYKAVMDVIAKLQRALTASGFITGVRDVATVKRAVAESYKAWAKEYENTGGNLANLTEEGQAMLQQFYGLAATDASATARSKRKAERAAEDKPVEAPEQGEATSASEKAETPAPAPSSPFADPVERLAKSARSNTSFNDQPGVEFARLGERDMEQTAAAKGAGKSDVGHRRQLDGRYVGAPAWVGSSPQQLTAMRAQVRKLALEGEPGRMWYEQSSRAILRLAGGDRVEAEKIVGLIAIYSPHATVAANTSMALNAYYQFKAGLPIKAGTGLNNRKAEDLLRHNKPWEGIKTNSFYQNLMVEIDPSKLDNNVSTMDMWMALAFDYGSKQLSGEQYKFAERETARLGQELGWTAHQVQAGVWTAAKARIEGSEAPRKAYELRKGIAKIEEEVDSETGKTKSTYVVQKGRERDHFHAATAYGMKHTPTPAEIDEAKYDFSHALEARAVQMSWEATPGDNTGVLPGMLKASLSQQMEYLTEIRKALTDDNGHDLVARAVGIPEGVTINGISAWEGGTGAGAQTFVSVALDGAADKRTFKPASKLLLDAYAAARGLLLRQKAVVYHLPVYDAALKRQNGVSLTTNRPVSQDEMQQLYDTLHAEFGTWELAPAYREDGVRILNFVEGLSNLDFQKRMEAVASKLSDNWGGGITEAGRFMSVGDYISNDWETSPNGESYVQNIATLSSDLQGRVAELQPRVLEVNKRFSDKYGWGSPGLPISFKRDDELAGGVAPRAGSPVQGRIDLIGTHFSQAPRTSLDGRYYGTGLKGAEATRLASTTGPRIRERVYAYVDEGQGIRPEAGVGGVAHRVDLSNLYDSGADVLGLNKAASPNERETAILDAGFDGYYVPKVFNNQGVAVILGKASRGVKVTALPLGTKSAGVNTGTVTAPKTVFTRTEGDELVRKPDGQQALELIKSKPALQAAAPSYRMEYGSARVNVAERAAANQVLAEAGSSFAFARNALKMESVQDALDFTATGDLKLNLGDALERAAVADAIVLAKSPDEVKGVLSRIGDRVVNAFADSRIAVSRWVSSLPLSEKLKQTLEGDMRRSDSVRADLEGQVTSDFTEPMMKAITKAASSTKRSSDQVKKMAGYWMTARYAPEASAQLVLKDRVALREAQRTGDPAKIAQAQQDLNDRILSVNGSVGDVKTRGVGGGMNDAEAALMKANVEAKIPVAMLEEIAAPIYRMLAWKKAKDLASGKVTQTAVNSWLNSPYYVPLTGDPRATREDNDVFTAGGQVNQDSDHAMEGRKDSVADDALDAAFTATIKSINFAAMQDFKKTLNKTYEAAMAAGFDIGLTREPVTGIMRTGDDVVLYRDTARRTNGTEYTAAYAFRFADAQVIESLKKDNVEHLNGVLKVFAAPTRWYARAVTQFMPFFAPINLVRDIWERSEVLRTKKLYDAAGLEVDVGKAARASIADVLNRDLWKASMMKAFKRGGMNPVRGDLEEMIRLGGSSTTGGHLNRAAGDLEASIRGDASRLGHATNKVMHVIEAYNDTFEMIPSLAIYRALKAQGMEPKDAAAATLDLMNFHKKGANMTGVRSLYVFAQPAATSGYNLARYLSTRTGQIRFATQALIGAALYAFLKGVWGDEDDEELGNKLDNLSNFTVERTIPIKIGDYVLKVPVGFGPPQLAWMTAGVVNRYASGRYNGVDAMGEMAKGWAKNFVPVAPSDIEVSKNPAAFLMQTFAPTILKPLVNIYADQTSFGGPLTPVFKNPDKLRSEQAKRTTAGTYSEVAKYMQENLGIDMYPDHIKAISDGVLVGPLREIMNLTVEWEAKKARGEPNRVPIVASLVDSINDRTALNQIYARVRGDMDGVHREYSSLKMEGDPDMKITPEMIATERAYQKFLAVEKVLGVQRSALKKMKIDPDLLAEKTQSIEERADAAHRKLLVEFFQGR